MLQSELKPLTAEERDIIIKIRNKKRKFFLSSFTILVLVFCYSFHRGYNRKNTGYPYYRRLSEEEIAMIHKIAPWFFMVVSFALILYLINYYFYLVRPFSKDIKKGHKRITYFSPGKYQIPFFEAFYIETPIKGKERIKISRELFDSIQPGSKGIISHGINSNFVYSIEIDERIIRFNETNEPLDV